VASALGWERLTVKLSDGDTLVVQLLRGKGRRVIHLFPDPVTGPQGEVIQRIAQGFADRGDTVMLFQLRGLGDGACLATKPHHLGATQDLAAVLQTGRGLFPDDLHLAVALGATATTLLLLLGRDRQWVQPDRALAINPWLNPALTVRRLSQGLRRCYGYRYVRAFRAWMKTHRDYGVFVERRKLKPWSTLERVFDRFLVRPAGQATLAEYLESLQVAPWLEQVRIPTVILVSQDDPIVPVAGWKRVRLSPSVHLHRESTGGHLGYLSRGVPGMRWLVPAVEHYVDWLTATPVQATAVAGMEQSATLFLTLMRNG